MPNTFKNVLYNVTSTLATFYTAPSSAGGVAIVIGCQATNKTGGTVALDLIASDGSNPQPLLNDLSIPVGASADCLAGKLVLEQNDVLRAQCSVTGDVAIVLSVLEIT